MSDLAQEARAEANSGTGWYEVIHPQTATTEIVRVMEDGSIYCPEGVLTREEFAFASARGRVHRLVRADDPPASPVTRETVTPEALAHELWRSYSGSICGRDGCRYENGENDADYECGCTECVTTWEGVADTLIAAFDIRERSES
ncbi:hypothetical protein [Microbacterium album]|uniref:Uncharacterized protein n=1 Tax=Microbacterium album TaxID=2053191 RepID=A0A917MMB3_9MICO|nr:hypothetical protein [Microbacterium album]GGH34109.1 hypothetical protein GCM10010921_01550 [Microbacterium album]